MTVVFLTKDVCLSGTISTLRFAAPGRLRTLDIIEPENRHSQTPQGTYWLNMTLTSQESSHTGFTHHHIIDIAWSWSQNTPPPYTSYCLAGPDRTSISHWKERETSSEEFALAASPVGTENWVGGGRWARRGGTTEEALSWRNVYLKAKYSLPFQTPFKHCPFQLTIVWYFFEAL